MKFKAWLLTTYCWYKYLHDIRFLGFCDTLSVHQSFHCWQKTQTIFHFPHNLRKSNKWFMMHKEEFKFIDCGNMFQGPIALTIFHHNSNSMEISFSCNSVAGDPLVTKFCTCYDSTAVMPCAKLCSDHFIRIWVRAKWNFHHIWIVMETSKVWNGPKWPLCDSWMFRCRAAAASVWNSNRFTGLKLANIFLWFHPWELWT